MNLGWSSFAPHSLCDLRHGVHIPRAQQSSIFSPHCLRHPALQTPQGNGTGNKLCSALGSLKLSGFAKKWGFEAESWAASEWVCFLEQVLVSEGRDRPESEALGPGHLLSL